MPLFDGQGCGCEHVAQFLETIVGERRDAIVLPYMNDNDNAMEEVVIVAEDGLERPEVLAQPACGVRDGADIGRCCPAEAWKVATLGLLLYCRRAHRTSVGQPTLWCSMS